MSLTFNGSSQYLRIQGLTTSAHFIELEMGAPFTAAALTTYANLFDCRPSGTQYVYQNPNNTILSDSTSVSFKGSTVSSTPSMVTGDLLGFNINSGNPDIYIFTRYTVEQFFNAMTLSAVRVYDSSAKTTLLHSYDLTNPTSSTVADSVGTVNATLVGFTFGDSISATTIDTTADTISGTGSFPNTLSGIAISAGGGTDTINTGITSTSSSFNAAYTPVHVPFTSSSVNVTLTDSTNATASFTTSIAAPTGYQAVIATAPINTDPSQSVLTSSNVAGDQMLTATRDDNNLGSITQNPDGSLKFTWDSGTPPSQTTFTTQIWDSVNHLRGAVETISVVNGAIVSGAHRLNPFSFRAFNFRF